MMARKKALLAPRKRFHTKISARQPMLILETDEGI